MKINGKKILYWHVTKQRRVRNVRESLWFIINERAMGFYVVKEVLMLNLSSIDIFH